MPLTQDQLNAALATPNKPQPPPIAQAPATPTPAPQTLVSHAGPAVHDAIGSALAPFIPVATGAARVAGTGVGKAIDVLNRPSAASMATSLRGPKAGLQTAIHSNTPEQYTADTAELARRDMANTRMFSLSPLLPSFGPKTGPQMTKAEYDAMPGWWHQAIELATQIKHDPLTYAGGAGILSHLGEAIGSKSVIGLSRAVEAMGNSANPEIRKAAKGLASAFDVTHYKGATQRALAAKYGDEGLHYFRGLKAINNARRTKQGALGGELLNQYHDVTHGLNEADESALYDAIHNGTLAQLPPNLAMRAAKFKQVTDSLAHLEGTEELQKLLGSGENPDLYRYQQTAGEESSTRGGIFFSHHPEYAKNYQYTRGLGGQNLVTAMNQAKNPLVLAKRLKPYDPKTPAWLTDNPIRYAALNKLVPKERAEAIESAFEDRADRAPYLREVGVSEEDIKKLRSPESALDRYVAELAKKQGYDAITNGDEFLALHPNSVRSPLAGQGFELDKSLRPFEHPEPRSLQGAESYRKNYVPLKSETQRMAEKGDDSLLGKDQAATAEGRSLSDILMSPVEKAERTSTSVEKEDKNLLERGEGAKLLSPDLQRRVIAARLKTGAAAISAHDAELEVAKLFGKNAWAKVPNDAKAFFQETYKDEEGKDWWLGLFKKGIDIPKAALFALPFRHMANIASLSFLADPSIANITGTAGRFMRLILARDPEARAKIMGKAGEYGIGATSFDRKPGWVGQIPLLGRLYKASNHTLWTFDDAAKATRFDRLLKGYKGEGMDEAHAAYKAADQVGAELVDYSNSSPLTEMLRYILPFASWRTKFPLAVAHSVSRRPEVAANIARRAPALAGDVQSSGGYSQYGEEQGVKSNLPLAEAFRGIDNPWEFGRAALGYPAQIAASKAGIHGDDYKNYMTYGKDPDLKYLLNATVGQFPGASAGLNKAGLGEFQTQGDMSGAIGQQLGMSKTHGPSPQQQETALYVQQQLAMINSANKAGNRALATAIEGDLKSYLKNHSQYEK